ncbi:hypothetical protein AXF14_12130 [Actinomyces radicidentis]|uniref:Uncharacterized protein n=2 Tax=Actinomyces radicidentis TaxID=111015 RepID=A0A0X8JG14_ACTRD|nr:hypothetical protein AXF14_12130 [Actinomyces radicidentis]
MKAALNLTISVEYRGQQVNLDHLFYKWLRCELVHSAKLPDDLRIDDEFSDPNSRSVRAGGPPEYTVLLSPGWYFFLTRAVREAPANADIF